MTVQPAESAAPPGALARVYRNAGKLLGGKLAGGLIGIVYLSLAARTLGAEGFGVLVLINFYALLVGNFLVLQGWHTLLRFGSASLPNEAPDDFKALFAFVARCELLSGLAAILLTAACARSAGHFFGWPDSLSGFAALYSLAIISNTQTTPAGVLNLFGRFDLLSLQQTLSPIVRLVGVALAWLLDAGIEGFLLAWLMGAIGDGLGQWWLGLRELRRRGYGRAILHSPAGITHRHPGIWRFLIANNLDIGLSDAANRITPLAVGAILNPAAVGLYHLALRIGMVLQQPVLVLGRTIYPELARLAAGGERGAMHALALRTGAIAAAAGLGVTLVFVVAGKPLLQLIGGSGFDGAYTVLLLIALARTIHLFGFPLGSALVALGRPNVTLWINFAVTIVLLPVLYGLLTTVDVAGAGLHAIAYASLTVGLLAAALFRASPPSPAAATP